MVYCWLMVINGKINGKFNGSQWLMVRKRNGNLLWGEKENKTTLNDEPAWPQWTILTKVM